MSVHAYASMPLGGGSLNTCSFMIAISPRVNSIPACVFKLSPCARTKLDTQMPIERVIINYNEPEQTDPEGPYRNPVVGEYHMNGRKKVIIHFNKRIGRMTEADLRNYEQWVDRLPRVMQANGYHLDFTEVFCDFANMLAYIIQTRLDTTGLVSPDLHE